MLTLLCTECLVSASAQVFNADVWHNLTIIELAMWLCGCLSAWPCVWQSTPRTADVVVTKLAGYVRLRILMNRRFFFVFLSVIVFKLRPLFTRRVHMHLHAAHKLCTHAEPFDWLAGARSSAVSRVSRMVHTVAPFRGYPACYI